MIAIYCPCCGRYFNSNIEKIFPSPWETSFKCKHCKTEFRFEYGDVQKPKRGHRNSCQKLFVKDGK